MNNLFLKFVFSFISVFCLVVVMSLLTMPIIAEPVPPTYDPRSPVQPFGYSKDVPTFERADINEELKAQVDREREISWAAMEQKIEEDPAGKRMRERIADTAMELNLNKKRSHGNKKFVEAVRDYITYKKKIDDFVIDEKFDLVPEAVEFQGQIIDGSSHFDSTHMLMIGGMLDMGVLLIKDFPQEVHPYLCKTYNKGC